MNPLQRGCGRPLHAKSKPNTKRNSFTTDCTELHGSHG